MSDQHSAVNHIVPKLIVVIVDWDKVSKVKEIINDTFAHPVYIISGVGTAKSELLDVLGVGCTEKAIIAYILPNFHVAEVVRILNYRLEFDHPGMGVAFSIPLSGITQPLSRMFGEERIAALMETLEPEKRERFTEFIMKAKEHPRFIEGKRALERMRDKVENEMEKPHTHVAVFKHDMILAVINKGYSDELIVAAKGAGARGGTIIQARRTGPDEAIKFFGITLQAEKEIVAILTERENKKAIMKAINQSCGLSSDAAGIVFSVPVDDVAGLSCEPR